MGQGGQQEGREGSSFVLMLIGASISRFTHYSRIVERFTEGKELIGAAEVQLQSDLIR